MNKRILFFPLLFILPAIALSQDTIPHISGSITLSVKTGMIQCDLTLSNMPRLNNYYLRLNSGMNIRYIRNGEGKSSLGFERSMQDSLSSGESSAYYIPAYTASGKYLPRTIHFNYVGMYPVITDSSSVSDWRGNIAFNGKTLRADGIQSAWCPILYDVKTDTRYEKVTYDLDITCNDCRMIYLNGSLPVTGIHAVMKSSAVQDLTLFAGDYQSVAINGSYFLNPDANESELRQFEKGLHACQDFLEHKLSIPYKGKPVYIQTTPVSKYNSWQFASYPTIVKIGWGDGMKEYVSTNASNSFRLYMAHELAHYYFGTYRNFNSTFGDALSEGFAEFIAFNISRAVISDSAYLEKLKAKVHAMRNFKPLSFSGIHSKNDYQDRELYVYYYSPLIFLAIQKEIGDARMWEWVKALLQTPTVFTNYEFVKQTLEKVLKDPATFNVIRKKYFESDQAFKNAATTLQVPMEGAATSSEDKSATRTYYFFFFQAPAMDAGTSQNLSVKRTGAMEKTCTAAELDKFAESVSAQFSSQCENEGGCSLDLNSFDSMEKAKAAIIQWENRYTQYKAIVIKEIKVDTGR